MKVVLANPRGFCAGVDRAILLVERALLLFGKPVYVRHEIVHNKHVVAELEHRGVVFVEDIRDVPPKSIVIFSAHGSSKDIRRQAEKRQLRIFDAICPLVTKVHMEVQKFAREGYTCILIGHLGHPEVEGTMGQYDKTFGGDIHIVGDVQQARELRLSDSAKPTKPDKPAKLAYVTQTTLSVDDTKAIIRVLKQRFPHIREPAKDDICYATQNRQDAVKKLAKECDLILVIGSRNSSNSNRLCEIARIGGCTSYLIDDADCIKNLWLKDAKTVGITAGASAPEKLVQELLDFFRWRYKDCDIRDASGKKEDVIFNLPTEIRKLPIRDAAQWESLSELSRELGGELSRKR